MRFLLCFLIITSANCLFGQEPSFFFLGEAEFEGIDIYDVIQDKSKNYWFATDQGLYVHDGYTFEKVSSDVMKASSVFSLKSDSKGRIYCYNLSHQVFRIVNNKIELFYDIPKNERSHLISIAIDDKDHVLVQSKSIVRISPHGERKTLIPDCKAVLPLIKHKDAIYSVSGLNLNEPIWVIKNEKATKETVKTNCDLPHSEAYYTEENGNSDILISRNGLQVHRLHPSTYELRCTKKLNTSMNGQVLRLYKANNQLWLTGQTHGIYLFDLNFNPLFDGKKLLENYFVSDVFEDHEGNILLSTFDKGVLVISNANLRQQSIIPDATITQITSADESELIFGTSNGKVILYRNGEYHTLDNGTRPKLIKSLEYWEDRGTILYEVQEGYQLLDNWKETPKFSFETFGSLKAMHSIDSEKAILGFNHGTRIIEAKNGSYSFSQEFIIHDRIYSVAFDSRLDLAYAGTAEGFKKITRDSESELVKFKNKVIFANDIHVNDDRMYIGTKRNGVLIFQNSKFIDQIQIEGQVMKTIVYEGKCFIHSRSGLFMHDLQSNKTSRINQIFGLQSRKIIDFHITNGTLYISGSNGLQFLPLDKLNRSVNPIPIERFKMFVEGKPVTSKKLSYNAREIEFRFAVSTLRHRGDITYLYMLEGYDNQWHELPYDQNYVKYNALAPGDYTFVVKSKNQDVESIAMSSAFSIAAPFYLKWWFYLIVTIFTVSIVFLVFRRRLKMQQVKAAQEQELNASKLTAIQSQMNPHFIFNALNSIQDLVIQGNTEKSYSFITKFANLVRSTLNYSDKDFIEFDEEVQLLELYLTLEKLRFKDDLNYDIETNQIEGVRIPPMLIQPFIENALVHGLLHKEGLGELKIEFKLENHLICTITDNGIGREKAREIKTRQKNKHESFAIKAIKRRMEILRKRFGSSIGFQYEDLKDGNRVLGTKVTLTIPVDRQF